MSTLFATLGANRHIFVISTDLPGLIISAFGLLVGLGGY